ncbi:MAG: molybdate ABC transporter substrate-binding protein [Myxococcales bacterium]|jgi:molybdate transport system substrate-binding protein|nr:molybdate ABC transporter substrate-binding protein [Myxococcales bacterium]
MWARSSRATEVLALALALAGGACSRGERGASAPKPLRVAAAADLGFAFKEMGAAYEKKTGQRVDFSFGSTGLLAKQIIEGAPFDVFAAANVSFVDDVVKSGRCREGTKARYAQGRIVVWAKDPGQRPAALADLAQARYAKIGIANPEHAPYGRAAVEALTSVGAWEAVKPRAVYGENVQQTLVYAQSGNTDVSIVALSLAVVSKGAYTPIDPALHKPLDQALVVCDGGGQPEAGRGFAAFVGSPEGRAIMTRYGFLLPGETM